jgi:hypothetical protein
MGKNIGYEVFIAAAILLLVILIPLVQVQTVAAKKHHSDDGGGSSSGQSRQSLTDTVCNFANTNPVAAASAAVALGYPGLDSAVRFLCAIR